MANLIPGTHLIYHGAEPSIPPVSKNEARRVFALPKNSKLALALGFKTATKGWDLIKKIKVIDGWKIVVNGSKNHFSIERHSAKYASSSVIELERGFLNDEELTLLFFASDAIILPYKVTSGSGVMFDGLAHGLPFISSDIEFFREFTDMGLGISVRRNPIEFSRALCTLEQSLHGYKTAIEKFRKNLFWEVVAKKHVTLYDLIVNSPNSPLLKQNMFNS